MHVLFGIQNYQQLDFLITLFLLKCCSSFSLITVPSAAQQTSANPSLSKESVGNVLSFVPSVTPPDASDPGVPLGYSVAQPFLFPRDISRRGHYPRKAASVSLSAVTTGTAAHSTTEERRRPRGP